MTSTDTCKLIAVIGGGVIGGGWVARCLLNGITVNLYDPDPNAPRKIDDIMINAKLAFDKLIDGPAPPQGKLQFTDSVASAVAGANLIIEAVPERLDIKQSVYRDIEAAAGADTLIASSTSGILPSDLQDKMTRPTGWWWPIHLTRCICCRWLRLSAVPKPAARPSKMRWIYFSNSACIRFMCAKRYLLLLRIGFWKRYGAKPVAGKRRLLPQQRN